MLKDTLIMRGIARGWSQLKSNHLWLVTLNVVASICFILQITALGAFASQALYKIISERTDIHLEVRSNASTQQAAELYAALQQLPYTSEVIYLTKEQSYDQARQDDPELIAFVEKYNLSNPFGDAMGITLQSITAYPQLRAFLNQPEWQAVVDPTMLRSVTNQEQDILQLTQILTAARTLVWVLLAVIAAVIVLMTIELAHRRTVMYRDQLLVEQNMGASPLIMFIPFATEAAVLLFFGMVLGTLFLAILIFLLLTFLPALQGSGIFAPLASLVGSALMVHGWWLWLVETIAVVGLGFVGTWLGIMPILRHPLAWLHHHH